MRLAFVSLMGGLPWGGSETLWKATALEALSQNHQVFVSVYDWGRDNFSHIKELQRAGANLQLRKKWDSNETIYSKIKRHYAHKFTRLSDNWSGLVDFKPDIVFISQGADFDIAMHHQELYHILINNNISYSFICHSHDQYSFFPNDLWYGQAQQIFENSQKVYFVSRRQWQLTERKLCRKLTNASVTWNPLNLKNKNYISWPEIEPVQMAIVGNLISGKGHDTLFEVLSAQKWREREYTLNIYGKGPGEYYLRDLGKFYDLNDSVKFKGTVISADEIWVNNHILVVPSSGEGLPISLVEAGICGRPAIVTDVGGNIEIISENETGFIAEAPSVSSFAQAMDKAWENKSKWKEMGEKAFKFCSIHVDFKPEKALLKSLINK